MHLAERGILQAYNSTNGNNVIPGLKGNSCLANHTTESYVDGKTYSKCFVVGYSACEAYNDGKHDLSEDYILDFVDYVTAFNEISVCTVCGKQEKVNENDFAPIFVFVGYSVKENGDALCVGYTVNHDSVDVYKKYNPNAILSYGIVASKPNTDGSDLIKVEDGKVVSVNTNTVVVDINSVYTGFDFILTGFNDTNKDTNLVICSYVFDGNEFVYMTNVCTATVPDAITYNYILSEQNKEN